MKFSLPAGNSRRRRRLKKPGASAPGFIGGWGGTRPALTEPKARPGQPPTSKRWVYTEALLATMMTARKGREKTALFGGHYPSYNGSGTGLMRIA